MLRHSTAFKQVLNSNAARRAFTTAAKTSAPLAAMPSRGLSTLPFRNFGSWTKEQILDELKVILQEFERVDLSKFHESADFTEIGLDSLDGVECIVAIEEKFDIELPDEEAQQLVSVDKAVESIINHTS
jgi:acyl carrier protein